jgi:CHAT domain-containing protein/tetratricopeptide (TPR) repeat protein
MMAGVPFPERRSKAMIRRLLAAFLVATMFSDPSLAAPTIQRAAGGTTIQRTPSGTPLQHRMGQMTPTTTYYKGFIPFYDGDYANALKTFQAELRGSIKTTQSLWIDSICYETMCGECYYQMGVFDRALFHYSNALQLYKRFPDWMMKVQFEAAIRVAQPSARKTVPWGASTRRAKLGRYRDNESILQSFTDANMTAKMNAVVQQPFAYPITPHEIVRCTTLALRRRAELLGPVAKYDELSNAVAIALARPVGLPNHWSGAWIDVEHGLALLASGRDQQAIPYLRRAELAGGEFDHPMTCVVLLELGRLALKSGEYAAAAKLFDEATYAAMNNYSSYPWFPDYGVIEEAFRYGTITHLMANRKGMFPPLEPAVQWAKTKAPRQLRASLLLCAAESYAVLGETRKAAAMLDDARFTVHSRKMGGGRIGARLSYLTALVAYQQKRISEGNSALSGVMGYMRHGSLWLFQIGLADRLYTNGDVTPRAALDLFADVLRDPLPTDWAFDPMESLAALTTPQPAAMDHWFEATMERQGIRDVQTSIDVAERTRRRRFFNSLDFGGRLESLRWILEAPPGRLPQQAVLQRQDMLARYPAYDQLSRKSQSIREALANLPLAAEDQKAAKTQMDQLAELAAVGAQQEAMLREIALRREPADLVFPPQRSLADVQKSLPKKHAVLAFFASKGRLYGFLLDNERCKSWRVASAAALQRQMQAMFRDMGQFGQTHKLTVKELGDEKWRQSGKQVLATLLKDSPADFSQSFDELVVVPDGILWYLPFEALQVTVDGQPQSLISRFHIRYAPTLALCTSPGPARNALGNTAVVLSKLYSRDAEGAVKAAFEQLTAAVPGAVAIRTPAPAATSIYGTLFRRLIVFDDLVLSDQDPYGWVLAPIDRGKIGATLADWLALPWGGPEVVILPGFHTAAEDGLKHLRRGSAGNEVFLSVCGLMANGARTMLLSRWRTGGQTTFDLVREFVQELPNDSASDAWQRAVLLTMDSRVSFSGEPRIERSPTDKAPKANHPFFWAGYMLVDSGATAAKSNEPPDEPVKIKPPKPPEKGKAAAKDEPKRAAKDRLKTEKKSKPIKKPKAKPNDRGAV